MSFSSSVKEEILSKVDITNQVLINSCEAFGENLTQVHLKSDLKKDFEQYLNIENLNENEIKLILKGCFLSSGYVANPNMDYHLEIAFRNKACCQYLYNLLSLLDFSPRISKRKNCGYYIVYIKEADQISLFLSMIEVSKSLLDFEQVRVEKEVKNNINRNINCETSNFAKTMKTSLKQIESIKKIKKAGLFDDLDKKLKETANLRLKYLDKSLDYISNQTTGKDHISKSGLKHRLDKIIEIADGIK